MDRLIKKLATIDWAKVATDMHEKGYAVVPNLLSEDHCESLKKLYELSDIYRKTVPMERYRFGLGEYKYFHYPLPPIIQTIREYVYPNLAPIANLWMKALKIDTQFPKQHTELVDQCRKNSQLKPTPLILKYGKGGFNTLHQDLYGDVFFPIQTLLLLSKPDEEFKGGEFVMTEQIPRAQSKVIVLKPKQGDMVIFTTNFRPVKGVKGYYRVTMKHGVSEVESGERFASGVIFHDALS